LLFSVFEERECKNVKNIEIRLIIRTISYNIAFVVNAVLYCDFLLGHMGNVA
jgi:hypothetical protein